MNRVPDKKQYERQRRARQGFILYYLYRVSAWLYGVICESAVGRYLSSYSRTEQAARQGKLYRMAHSQRKRSDRPAFRFRMGFSSMIENSTVCRAISRLLRGLLGTGLNSYAIFFLFFGGYSVIAYFVMRSIAPDRTNLSCMLTGAVMVVFSLPLFSSRMSLIHALHRSHLAYALFVDGLGLRESGATPYEENGREYYALALALSAICGALTIWIPPYRILAVAALVVFVCLVMHSPEIGMLTALLIAPLLGLVPHPTLVLLAVVALTLLSYVGKIICGKRVFRMSLVDGAVIALLALFLFGGLVSRGGSASLRSALTYACLLMIWFMVSNLVRSEKDISRVVCALLIGAVPVSLIGLWQYFFGDLTAQYLDLSLFSDIGGRVYSTLDNPNMLAEYLVLILPFTLSAMLRQRRVIRVFGCLLSACAMTMCLIFTWSRGAWLGAILSALIFLLLTSHRALSWTALLSAPVVATVHFLPEQLLRRFASIGSTADSSIRYRLYLWDGVERMLGDWWFCGVGVGEDAFRAVYVNYALPGIEQAMHAHSLYLQLLCAFGVAGLVAFALILLLWLRRALEYYRLAATRSASMTLLAGIAGIAGILLMGCFDDVWYNYRIFFLFWAVMGLVNARIRVGTYEAEREYNPVYNEKTQGEATIRFL